VKAYDFDAAIYNGEVYCIDCLPVDPDDPEVMPIFASDEWDFYPVCDVCGYEHDYVALTSKGLKYYGIE